MNNKGKSTRISSNATLDEPTLIRLCNIFLQHFHGRIDIARAKNLDDFSVLIVNLDGIEVVAALRLPKVRADSRHK